MDGASTCLSSRSFNSSHSLQATGPDPYEKFRIKPGKSWIYVPSFKDDLNSILKTSLRERIYEIF